LAMGMAMTILSFAMLERCTGVQVGRVQTADLNPVRVWGGVEDKAMRVKDQAMKYYENLRIVYEVETHLKDLEEPQETARAAKTDATNPKSSSSGASHTSPTTNGAGLSQPPGKGKP